MIRNISAKEKDGIGLAYPVQARARDFDAEIRNRFSSVDVILDFPDKVYFVELKNPDNPKALSHPNKDEWFIDFRKGLKDELLCKKFAASFIHEWKNDRVNKPIIYFVIIAMSSLDSALLLRRNEALSKARPFTCNCHFKKYVQSWSIHNIKSFNALMAAKQEKNRS